VLLLELPVDGGPPALAHLSRVIPPRLARVRDLTPELGAVRVLGLEGWDLLSRIGLGFRVEAEELDGMEEGEVRAVGSHPGRGLRVRRVGDFSVPSWEIVADRPTVRGLWTSMLGAGAVPVGAGVSETLRVEAGRPAYGQDMDDGTSPIEAGVGARAIDDGKGCYTCQEVIVRIRDRGHVNRHLRGLRFGSELAAAPGSELFGGADGEKQGGPVGVVTSEALSPRVGASIGLGYVRREVSVPGVVHLGSPDGPRVEVRELSGPGWAFD
jgi:folate-binding protein YgfZ